MIDGLCTALIAVAQNLVFLPNQISSLMCMETVIKYFKSNSYLMALIIIFGLSLLILATSGSLFSGYHLTDDHWMITLHNDLQKMSAIEVLIQQIKSVDFAGGGRFRPFFIFHTVMETKLFGINLILWSAYTGMLFAFTTFFLFIFARLIQFSFKQALFFSLLSVLGPQSVIGWRLFLNETIGMFFLSLSLMFLAMSVKANKRNLLYEILFIFSILLMSLSKESFIIFIPAIAFIKVWVFCKINNASWYQSLSKNILSLSILLLTCFSEILFIKFFVGTNVGYAGFTGFDFLAILGATKDLISGYWWLMLFCLISMLIEARRLDSNPILILTNFLCSPFFLLFLLIVAPQILIYSKSGMFERYLLPGALGCSILILYMYRFIKENSRTLGRLTSLLIIASLAFKLSLAWNSSYKYAIEGKRTNELLSSIERNTVPNDRILIVTNPFLYYEWSSSIKDFLNYLMQRNNLYLVTYGGQKSDFITNTLEKEEAPWYFLDPKKLKEYYNYQLLDKLRDKESVRCVVVFPELKNDFLNSSSNWFSINNFKEYIFDLMSSKEKSFSLERQEIENYIKKNLLHKEKISYSFTVFIKK